jgi:hypothetical protein
MRRWRYALAMMAALGIVAAWRIPQSLNDTIGNPAQPVQGLILYPGSKIESLRVEKNLLRLRSLSQQPATTVYAYYRQRFEGRDGWVTELMIPTQMRFHRDCGKGGLEHWFEDEVDIAIMSHRDGTRIFISYDTLEQCVGLC